MHMPSPRAYDRATHRLNSESSSCDWLLTEFPPLPSSPFASLSGGFLRSFALAAPAAARAGRRACDPGEEQSGLQESQIGVIGTSQNILSVKSAHFIGNSTCTHRHACLHNPAGTERVW